MIILYTKLFILNQKIYIKTYQFYYQPLGSMGTPKFVKLSKKNLKSNTDSIIKYLSITSNEKSITNMPVNYSYMLSIINSL